MKLKRSVLLLGKSKKMDRLSALVEQLQLEGNHLRQWQTMLSKYLGVINVAFQHENFGNDEI
jgi:hypothetical protein